LGEGIIITRYFRDPVHGLIPVDEREVAIIQSQAFQRLRDIRQLGNTYLVYHGAEHTRFGHSIGVMHLVSRAIDSLSKNGPLHSFKENHLADYNNLIQTARLAALLHDIGHGPFSHVGEDKEFGLFPELIDIDGISKTGHEVFSHLIIKNILGPEIEKQFTDIKLADILSMLLGTPQNAQQHFVCDLLDGQLDVDKMDYLLRDSHYCGVKYGYYDLDRIMDVICICPSDYDEWQLGVESDGVHAVEELIFARYWMFLQVYFHKTRRIYDYYLSHFLKWNCSRYPEDLEEYLSYTDSLILYEIRRSQGKNQWAEHLFTRKHMKEAYVSGVHQEDDEELDQLARLMDAVKKDYGQEIEQHLCYVDQADTSSAKSLIEIRSFKNEADCEEKDGQTAQDEELLKHKLPAIPVRDRHTGQIAPIQDYSLPIRKLSDKKINVFRIYADESIIYDIKKYIDQKQKIIVSEIKEEEKIQKDLKELTYKNEENIKNREERLNRYRK